MVERGHFQIKADIKRVSCPDILVKAKRPRRSFVSLRHRRCFARVLSLISIVSSHRRITPAVPQSTPGTTVHSHDTDSQQQGAELKSSSS